MLLKKVIIGMVLMCIAVSNSLPGATASGAEDRATWLWDPWTIVADQEGMIAFLENKKVSKIYLQIDPTISFNVYQSFIRQAGTKGIRIYALDGGPDWVAPKDQSLSKLMNWLSQYQKASPETEKFAGVHLDVEPYLYSSWSTNQAKTIKNYQSLLLKATKHAASIGLMLEADIPFWFDEIVYKNSYGKGNLAEWVIVHTAGVTIMAYRDSFEIIRDIAANEINVAKKHGKKVVVGVETMQSHEGNHVSFYEEGETLMNEELAKVKDHFAGNSGYGGIAVHHVASWMAMKQ